MQINIQYSPKDQAVAICLFEKGEDDKVILLSLRGANAMIEQLRTAVKQMQIEKIQN